MLLLEVMSNRFFFLGGRSCEVNLAPWTSLELNSPFLNDGVETASEVQRLDFINTLLLIFFFFLPENRLLALLLHCICHTFGLRQCAMDMPVVSEDSLCCLLASCVCVCFLFCFFFAPSEANLITLKKKLRINDIVFIVQAARAALH